MRHLKRQGPPAILVGQCAFLFAALAFPVNAARIVDAGMRAVHHRLGLNVLHHIPHRLARPHAVLADRRARQQFANANVRDIGAAQLGARLANCIDLFRKPLRLRLAKVIVAGDALDCLQ